MARVPDRAVPTDGGAGGAPAGAAEQAAAMPPRRGSLFGRLVRRLSASTEELHAEVLRDETVNEGAQAITTCSDRQTVRVAGVLRTVTFRPLAHTPALEADLWDGTGSVVLIWLGRRQIAGIHPGRKLVAWGRITVHRRHKVLFNPVYELRPSETGLG